MTKGITMATAKAVAAGNSAQQEDVIATANLSRKAISDMLTTCKVLIHSVVPGQPSHKHHQAANEASLLRADRTLEPRLLSWLLLLVVTHVSRSLFAKSRSGASHRTSFDDFGESKCCKKIIIIIIKNYPSIP